MKTGTVQSSDSDGKGTTTYSYDSTADHRGFAVSATDTLTGTTATAYDADGRPRTTTFPGGLTATTARDNDGGPIRLDYTKSSTRWITFTQTASIHDQIRVSSSPSSRQLYSYDAAARLIRTDDLAGSACTRRDYSFDSNSNRTGFTSTAGSAAASTPTALCDLTGAAATTINSTYDAADRATNAGYAYDNLGRTTSVPATAVTGGAALTVGYSANDMVRTLTQSGQTKTYSLDPAGRILTIADTSGPTLTDHYTNDNDNPAWIDSSSGTWTRYTLAPAGGLGLSIDSAGAVRLQLANLHGDIVATAAPSDTSPTSYAEETEYGLPRDAAANARYGWLGSNQRNNGDTLAQITLMGLRLYNPTTGRFLSTDPVPGGSATAYDYANQDPLNQTDLNGQWGFGHARWLKKWVRSMTKRQSDDLTRKMEKSANIGQLSSLLLVELPLAGVFIRLALEVGWVGVKGTADYIRQNTSKRGTTITVGLYYRPPFNVRPEIVAQKR